MCTNRLYSAVKEKQDAQAIYDAATKRNWGPDRVLPHNSEIVLRLRQANVELEQAMAEAQKIIDAPNEQARRVAVRLAGERDVARHLLKSLCEQGFSLGGNDGEEDVISFQEGWEPVFAVMFETDEFCLDLTRTTDGETINGWIHLIYGNSPAEMISNCTISVNKYTVPTQKYIKAFYDSSYIVDED